MTRDDAWPTPGADLLLPLDGVEATLGIRFATAERYEPSVPAEGSAGARTLAEVPLFPQLPGRLDAVMGSGQAANPQDENAFFLNVWAPREASDLPVLVFVHGGAWTTGGPGPWYDGTALARCGLVVVTLSYRLGPLAHLAPEPDLDTGALPLGDLLQGLRWVRDHVGSFGGDPDRVTLAGQSAGAWYVHLLNQHPGAAGLFRRAAYLSMSQRRLWSTQRREALSSLARTRVGGSLRTASVDAVLAAGRDAMRTQEFAFGEPPSGYLPTVSPSIPADLYDPEACVRRMHADALYLRTTADETGAFFHDAPERDITADQWADLSRAVPAADRALDLAADPYAGLVAQTTWDLFGRFAHHLADACRAAGTPVTTGLFTTSSPLPGFGAGHTLDLPYQFGNPDAWADASMLADPRSPEFAEQSHSLISDLARFARAERTIP